LTDHATAVAQETCVDGTLGDRPEQVERSTRVADQSRDRYSDAMLTKHTVHLADARKLDFVPSESVHLVVTSPPYGALINYSDGPNQLGAIQSYELFLDELDKAWAECFRVLVPGGRIACVVGDICLSRKRAGRHHVLPLAADIQVRTRRIGFDNLTPIRWMKVSNIRLEASTSSVFLGKPNLPNGVVKNDVESILFLRKPGGYRSPTASQEKGSFITTEDYRKWFCAAWTDIRGQIRRDHPAPYPVEIPRRLIRMFSFVGDTVLDPFAGTATTAVAAMECGRNSICVEIEQKYFDQIRRRLAKEAPMSASVDYFQSPSSTGSRAARRA
jgi:site-specific DNA-methyltransferase (adenine-specific)